ncbi:hypothetical protein CDES_02430 [Corynebacterium deserti GIMN1.010]|uniref:Uncharacterized protein n=1 Tax=Corynebacterium deserti GIMN1.010 TaxID=931089 RepID=A0A0M4CGX7_9CORY|nr:DUF4229 domain-containing protein [Corynebacterium deserti]ALC04946.1 hypothetical protein CDES_02430 [Corynebacterium deserti GIMN1.010]
MRVSELNISNVDSHQAPELNPELQKAARKNVLIYGLARILLFVVLTAIIYGLAVLISSPVPLVMCAMLALVVAFPLSMLVFDTMRMNATSAVAQWDAQRKAHKEWVRSELAGRE